MPEVWPTSLSQCPQSWSESPRDSLIRTEIDIGLSKVRRRYTAVITDVSVSLTMKLADYQTFLNWYATTLKQGLEPFTYKDPATGTVKTYRFREPYQSELIQGRAARVSMAWESVP